MTMFLKNISNVREGLVLHLDSANKKSYSGSANWRDMSGNNNSVTLINNPTFNSSYSGNIIFDGKNNYADFFASNLTGVATVEIWAKMKTFSTNGMIFGWLLYNVWTNGGNLGYNTGNSDLYGISSTTVSNLNLLNNWKHYVFEMRSDVPYTNNKIYINSVPQTLSQQVGTGETPTRRNFNSGNGRISGWGQGLGYHQEMDISSFKVYNRSLSVDEIKQNYNIFKNRIN